MTAQVLSLDGARVSARRVIDVEAFNSASHPSGVLFREFVRVRSDVEREARRMFGDAPRRKLAYITYEDVVDAPELDPVA